MKAMTAISRLSRSGITLGASCLEKFVATPRIAVREKFESSSAVSKQLSVGLLQGNLFPAGERGFIVDSFRHMSNQRRWMSSYRFPDDPQFPPDPSSGIDEQEGEEALDGEQEGDETEERAPSRLELMLEGVPRRRQRFLVQKALKIKPEGESGERASRRGFEMKVIDVNRTVKVTKGGKVQSFAALVVTGNYDGVVGFGKGKSAEIGPAIDKASRRALNNLHYFERYQGHTIFHEHDAKFEKTKVYLWPARSGQGMKASHTVGGILRLAGYKNVKSKVLGSRHPLNSVKAVFKTLSEIESPEEVAERRSRVVVESHLLADS